MKFQINNAKTVLSHQDKICLLSLLAENPFRNTYNYEEELYNLIGKVDSVRTIERFFKKGCLIKQMLGSQCMFHLISGKQRIS